jgi:hypothetical protein
MTMNTSLSVLAALAVVGSIAACGSGHSTPTGPPAPGIAGATPAPANAAANNCGDFDTKMQQYLSVGKDNIDRYARANGFTRDQFRDFFNDVCGDKAFSNLTGDQGFDRNYGFDPAASTFAMFVAFCSGLSVVSPADTAKAVAFQGHVSDTEAQAEVQKMRNHGCPRGA